MFYPQIFTPFTPTYDPSRGTILRYSDHSTLFIFVVDAHNGFTPFTLDRYAS